MVALYRYDIACPMGWKTLCAIIIPPLQPQGALTPLSSDAALAHKFAFTYLSRFRAISRGGEGTGEAPPWSRAVDTAPFATLDPKTLENRPGYSSAGTILSSSDGEVSWIWMGSGGIPGALAWSNSQILTKSYNSLLRNHKKSVLTNSALWYVMI